MDIILSPNMKVTVLQEERLWAERVEPLHTWINNPNPNPDPNPNPKGLSHFTPGSILASALTASSRNDDKWSRATVDFKLAAGGDFDESDPTDPDLSLETPEVRMSEQAVALEE